jgi:hypothetical protein
MKRALLVLILAIQFVAVAGVRTSTSEAPLPSCFPCPEAR